MLCVLSLKDNYAFLGRATMRNLYAGQEATIRTGHGTTDWFQIGKGVRKGCILCHSYFHYLVLRDKEPRCLVTHVKNKALGFWVKPK